MRPRRPATRVVAGSALLAALLGLVGGCEQSAHDVAGTAGSLTIQRCQNLVVPAYFYPGADWNQIDNGRPAPKIMIMDPAGRGAGSVSDQMYVTAAEKAQAAGTTILGYSDTDYGRRPATAVKADVRNYQAWYGVTSIFLDRVAAGAEQLPYYRELARYIHRESKGSSVVLNPGTYPDQGYMSAGDIIVAFENTDASYAGLQVPGWVRRYPAARFAHIVYATAAQQLAGTLALAARRHAGYVYVTDRSGQQRYGSLPSYWLRERSIIGRCATGTDAAGQPEKS